MKAKRLVLIALSAVIVTNCTSKAQKPENHASKLWPEKMQQLSQALSDLMPLISSKKKFSSAENQKLIEERTETLRTLAHSIQTGPKPNSDPSMAVLSGLMEEDLARALDAFRGGQKDYARHVLKDTTSYCIQCHTQTNNGPEFPQLKLNVKVEELPALDRAEFYAATRQFEPALETYRGVLADPSAVKADPFDYENAARTALAISVRVHKDPVEAKGLVETVQKNKALNPSQKKVAKSWSRSIQSWSKEKTPSAKPSIQQDLAKAESLVTRAQKSQEFVLDHSQDINYFRASSLLHEILQTPERTPEFSARALYLAGVSSEATRDMNFWTMHETMYEQCIRLKPQTEQAKQCYSRLNDSINLGYSGSSGTHIPPEVKRRLEFYKTLAFGS